MTSLMIKNIPENLLEKLKDLAELNHQSMDKQVISILEQALEKRGIEQLPAPVKLKFWLTNEWFNKAKCWGRQ